MQIKNTFKIYLYSFKALSFSIRSWSIIVKINTAFFKIRGSLVLIAVVRIEFFSTVSFNYFVFSRKRSNMQLCVLVKVFFLKIWTNFSIWDCSRIKDYPSFCNSTSIGTTISGSYSIDSNSYMTTLSFMIWLWPTCFTILLISSWSLPICKILAASSLTFDDFLVSTRITLSKFDWMI